MDSIRKPAFLFWLSLFVAALLWFAMFSPWTAPFVPFWPAMALSSVVLLVFARPFAISFRSFSITQILLGVAFAAVLWALFWVGDRVSSMLFDFARPQVEQVYAMKVGARPWLLALQLLLLTGPAEELFWRGYVQRLLSQRWGDNVGFVVATAVYTLIHIWSFNFMLTMSALVCGVVWGGLYRLRPQWLPALVLSHALWDACVFVVFPI